jgi:hypothetical protein
MVRQRLPLGSEDLDEHLTGEANVLGATIDAVSSLE